MSRVKRTIALVALMTAVIGGPAISQNMVVRSEGPSASIYRVGYVLPRGRPLLLQAGDHVTVSLETGRTRQFDGPGRNFPQQPSAQTVSVWTKLFEDPKLKRVLGTARGPGAAAGATPANVWQIDVGWPGDFCFAAGQPIELWRTETGDTTLVLTRMGGDGSKRRLVWRAGEAALAWPADLPLADGDAYLVQNTEGLDHGVLWRVVDPPSGDLTAFTGQLLQKGCFAQANTLRVALGVGESP